MVINCCFFRHFSVILEHEAKKSQPNPGNLKSTTKKTHANLHILHLPSACELMASGLEAGLRVLSMRHIF